MSGNSSYLEIPVDLLKYSECNNPYYAVITYRYLDEESSNPWIYMHEQLASCETATRHVSERAQAIEVHTIQ